MKKLVSQGSKKTPKVFLDSKNGSFELKGNSIPEDPSGFYEPILKKLEKYFQSPQPLTHIQINLNYFNSSSSKWIFNLLKLAKKYADEGHEIQIDWFIDEEDEDSKETVLDYQNLLDIPIRVMEAS